MLNGEKDLENHSVAGRKPVLMIVVGRQRVGKTSFLNALTQHLQERGGSFAIWDADQLNETNNMSVFHTDAIRPRSSDPEDVKAWLEARFIELGERGYDAVLDVGGGDTPLARLIKDVPVAATLEEFGVRLVAVHVVGPDMADLDYLDRFDRDDLFAPEAVLIVRNGGLVLTGRSIDFAFEQMDRHPSVARATVKGAELVTMPLLSCMAEVTDRKLRFADAMNGKPGADGRTLSLFDRARVRKWWNLDFPTMAARIPPSWLPETRSDATGTGG
jgi:hypothetical protein